MKGRIVRGLLTHQLIGASPEPGAGPVSEGDRALRAARCSGCMAGASGASVGALSGLVARESQPWAGRLSVFIVHSAVGQ